MGQKRREIVQAGGSARRQRLGLRIDMNMTMTDGPAGGGRWVTPEQEHADARMERNAGSMARKKLRAAFCPLPQPRRRLMGHGLGPAKAAALECQEPPGSYRDIAVYRQFLQTGRRCASWHRSFPPSGKPFDSNVLMDGNLETGIRLPATWPNSRPADSGRTSATIHREVADNFRYRPRPGRIAADVWSRPDDGTNFTPDAELQIPDRTDNQSASPEAYS